MSINVVRNWDLSDGKRSLLPTLLAAYEGTSRDPPTLFLYKCKNQSKGCTYSSDRLACLQMHEVGCTIAPKYDRPSQCSKCASRFETATVLRRNVQKVHNVW